MEHPSSRRQRRRAFGPHAWRWTLAITALFAFRLFFGLCFEFFFEDETQVFLIGLRAYANGAWPYFGADVVWTESQIPGALQGLLVALPLAIVPVPEAPFVLLNVLSMATLALLAWYVCHRLPTLPRWLVWGWLMTIPWTINFSTSLINTSYILPAAAVFFVGFFEAHPRFSLGRLPRPLAYAMMGVAITWMMQIHLSWPLLGPYVAAVFVSRRREGWRAAARDCAAVAAGASLPALLLIPTLVRHGWYAGSGGTTRNLSVHWIGIGAVISTLARFLSFASLEVVQFIATDTAKRVMFVLRHLWIAPLLLVVWTVGIIHPIWMLWQWFARRHPARGDWTDVKWLAAATVALVSISYCFVVEPPQAHAFYAVLPVAFIYAAYCFAFIDTPRWRTIAAALLAANIAYHVGLAILLGPDRSMYKNRSVVAEAVARPDPDVLAHRRPFARDATERDGEVIRNPGREIVLVDPVWSVHAVRAVLWNVTVRNESSDHAYRDLLYRATYRDGDGRVLDTRFGLVRDVFQPGEPKRVEINDGSVRVPFTSAALEVMLAETLKPLWPRPRGEAFNAAGAVPVQGARAGRAAFRH